MPKLPIQPLYRDDHGTTRFRENKVVRYLLDHGGLDLNQLTMALPDCREDWEQFAQLIGYSLSGFGDLSYVSDETYETAERLWEQPETSEQSAREDYAATVLKTVQEHVKELAVTLFRLHPEDFEERQPPPA